MDLSKVTAERDDRLDLLNLLVQAAAHIRSVPQSAAYGLLYEIDMATGRNPDAPINESELDEMLLRCNVKELVCQIHQLRKQLTVQENDLRRAYDAMSPRGMGSIKRDTRSIDGWVNELFLLAESNSFGASSSHVPYAIRVIAQGIRAYHKEDMFLLGQMADTIQRDMRQGIKNPTYNYVLDMTNPIITRERSCAEIKS